MISFATVTLQSTIVATLQRTLTGNSPPHLAIVTPEICADAILDIRQVIDTLWPKTIENNLNLPHKLVIEIARLYASDGDAGRRHAFEDIIRKGQWRPMWVANRG